MNPPPSDHEPTKVSAPPRRLRWSAETDRGKVRDKNEDVFLALTFDGHGARYLGKTGEGSLDGGDFAFAVSDGMGGARSGHFASRVASERITKLLPLGFRQATRGMSVGFPDILQEIFLSTHAELNRIGQSYEECRGMGATLSLAWFTPEWMYFGHLGDSRIYYFPATGEMRQLTHDHNHVGWLRRQGKISEREARDHPQRHSLQQALGASLQVIDPQIGAVGLNAGDRFLICSDGLSDGLWDRHLQEILQENAFNPETNLAEKLVSAAVEKSGRDNTTALVIEVN